MDFRKDKLIITVALTGNVPTKEINPYTPITTEEIVEDIIKCRKLGASVAHIHVRDEEGNPTSKRELYKEILDELEKKGLRYNNSAFYRCKGGRRQYHRVEGGANARPKCRNG